MGVVKQAVLLLLAGVGIIAASHHGDCSTLNKTLPKSDLHKILGHWVLVWSIADHQAGLDLLVNLSSSHVELELHHDNQTVMFREWNKHESNSCTNYFNNMTLSCDVPASEQLTLSFSGGRIEVDGKQSQYNDTGEAKFFEACAHCMLMVYSNQEGRFLLSYRREGQHEDAEHVKAPDGHHDAAADGHHDAAAHAHHDAAAHAHHDAAADAAADAHHDAAHDHHDAAHDHHDAAHDHHDAAHSHHDAVASCLGFSHDKPFHYDGVSAFCLKTHPVVTHEHS